jgi:hypothetical protein
MAVFDGVDNGNIDSPLRIGLISWLIAALFCDEKLELGVAMEGVKMVTMWRNPH